MLLIVGYVRWSGGQLEGKVGGKVIGECFELKRFASVGRVLWGCWGVGEKSGEE